MKGNETVFLILALIVIGGVILWQMLDRKAETTSEKAGQGFIFGAIRALQEALTRGEDDAFGIPKEEE